MATTLISFADSRLSASAARFESQAAQLAVFSSIKVFSEKDFTTEFQTRFEKHLRPGVRGFGFWVWKPWIIKTKLNLLSEGDILVYSDVGFRINPTGRPRLYEYLSRVKRSESGVLGFQATRPEKAGPVKDDGRSLPAWLEKYWSKGDLIDYFGVRDQPEIVGTPQIQSGLIFFRKCPSSLSFVDQWLEVYESDFALVDDSESRSNNFNGFREHRHDQSVYSLLGKLNRIDTISSTELWMPHWWTSIADWQALERTPFHARRDLDFGSYPNKSGANKDVAAKFTSRSLRYSFVLLFKRLANVFKPISKRYL